MAPGPPATPVSFAGLSYPVFRGVMKKGYKVPTPIQRKVWGRRALGVGGGGRLDRPPDSHPSSQPSRRSLEPHTACPSHRQRKLGPAEANLDPGPLCRLASLGLPTAEPPPSQLTGTPLSPSCECCPQTFSQEGEVSLGSQGGGLDREAESGLT